jgi:hypothetical protein
VPERQLGPYRLGFASHFGPRLTGLRRDEGPEIFATLQPRVALQGPLGTYHFHGGHRLWAAPEKPEITYAPDDEECQVSVTENSVSIVAPPDGAGLIKEMRVTVVDEMLAIDHGLSCSGSGPIEVSPWAITQFPLGGTAILPVLGSVTSNVTPNRGLVVWPYTTLDDPRLRWGPDWVSIHADPGPAVKLGSGPEPGSLGYLRDGHLFIKTLPTSDEMPYPDRGAVGQVFTNEEFCELESLGPLVFVEPGSQIWHRETWEVVPCPDLATALEYVMRRQST